MAPTSLKPGPSGVPGAPVLPAAPALASVIAAYRERASVLTEPACGLSDPGVRAWDEMCAKFRAESEKPGMDDKALALLDAQAGRLRSSIRFFPGRIEFLRSGLTVARHDFAVGEGAARRERFNFKEIMALKGVGLDVPSRQDWEELLSAMPDARRTEKSNLQLQRVLGLVPGGLLIENGTPASGRQEEAVYWTGDEYFSGVPLREDHHASSMAFIGFKRVSPELHPRVAFHDVRQDYMARVRGIAGRPATPQA